MKTIAFSDTIHATLRRGGSVIAMLTMQGITSMADVIRRIRQAGYDTAGMLSLIVRNATQGWTATCPVVICAKNRA